MESLWGREKGSIPGAGLFLANETLVETSLAQDHFECGNEFQSV